MTRENPRLTPEATLDGVPVPEWARTNKPRDFPTLGAIGLYAALAELERACSTSGGVARQDWRKKTIPHHTAKAIGHLSRFQCGETVDPDSKCSALAHVAGRALMALAVELAMAEASSWTET